MPVDLTECKAKIERSREHLPCLQTLVEPVIDGDDEGRVKVRAALDHESGYHVFPVVAMLSAWRLNSGLVLGDLVHNLRSALDYLFWQLYSAHICMPESAQKTRQVQFPIDDKYERFFERRKRFSDIPYSL
jgi:hypothetical protein